MQNHTHQIRTFWEVEKGIRAFRGRICFVPKQKEKAMKNVKFYFQSYAQDVFCATLYLIAKNKNTVENKNDSE